MKVKFPMSSPEYIGGQRQTSIVIGYQSPTMDGNVIIYGNTSWLQNRLHLSRKEDHDVLFTVTGWQIQNFQHNLQ
jgi:hypothetical protein